MNQADVVTLVLAAEDGVPTAERLVGTLPAAGFEVSGFTLRRTT
ncbi:hypothetical protein [Auraticoccus cholistanensis]|nr:hypothetical protein [Auraticoccus cholistanensis]